MGILSIEYINFYVIGSRKRQHKSIKADRVFNPIWKFAANRSIMQMLFVIASGTFANLAETIIYY